MKKALVISAHLDDAILSAGQFIAGRPDCDVLTVFSGIPEDKELLTDYDKSCGFDTSRDAMVIRREEDAEACAILNANPIHLDNLDSQYDSQNLNANLRRSIAEYATKSEYEMVIGPIGLRHPDHLNVSELLLSLSLDNLYLYEDLPHRVTHPMLVVERIAIIKQGGKRPKLEFIGDGPIADKVRALWCYRSQIGKGDLNPYNLYVPERFWKL